MRYEIEISQSEPTRTAVVRSRVRPEELPRFVPAACGEVWSFIRAANFGPYAGLSEAHAAIRAWCAERGHGCSVVSWEIYGHWEESWNTDPSKIRTDVFYLLDDAKG